MGGDELMTIFLASLGDPIWQIGGGIILLAELVVILALRSPEVYLAPRHQWFFTRLTLLVCLSLFLALSAGVVVFHGATAAPIGASRPSPTAVPSLAPLLSPSPSPTPFPRLVPGPSQVLTTFGDAIDGHDLNTAWAQLAKALRKERAAPPPFLCASRLSTARSIR
jgi:hypothetical protein